MKIFEELHPDELPGLFAGLYVAVVALTHKQVSAELRDRCKSTNKAALRRVGLREAQRRVHSCFPEHLREQFAACELSLSEIVGDVSTKHEH